MATEIRSYRDLQAWQAGFELGLRVHEVTKTFPDIERYALGDQLRRSGVSIASNIAEGYGRGRTLDYLRFLRMARGSLYEVDTQLCFAFRFGYFDKEKFAELQERVNDAGKLLAGLIRSVQASRKRTGN